MDSSNNAIEFKAAEITVKMISLNHLASVSTSLTNNTNGAIGNIQMTVVTNCPIINNSNLYFIIPT